jgi:hypothetical protein
MCSSKSVDHRRGKLLRFGRGAVPENSDLSANRLSHFQVLNGSGIGGGFSALAGQAACLGLKGTRPQGLLFPELTLRQFIRRGELE